MLSNLLSQCSEHIVTLHIWILDCSSCSPQTTSTCKISDPNWDNSDVILLVVLFFHGGPVSVILEVTENYFFPRWKKKKCQMIPTFYGETIYSKKKWIKLMVKIWDTGKSSAWSSGSDTHKYSRLVSSPLPSNLGTAVMFSNKLFTLLKIFK